MLLSLVGALLVEPELLLLDQPTNEPRPQGAGPAVGSCGRLLRQPCDRVHDLGLLDTIVEVHDRHDRTFPGDWHHYRATVAAEPLVAARRVRGAEAYVSQQVRELAAAQTTLERRARYANTAYEQKRQPKT